VQGVGRIVLSRWRHAGILTALFGLALLVRLPGLLLLPRFEDEGDGVLWALDIFRGEHLPTRAVRAYTGPLFAYLLAGLFHLLGPDLVWPRALVAVFGALTVPAMFVLGRAVAGPRVGLVAAMLALTNPNLALMTGRYGWSNSLTPFFATVTLAAIYVGATERRAFVLALGGLLAGLTLQTHATSIFLLAGIAAWFVLTYSPSEWFRGRHAWAAMLGFVVGYAPMLWNFGVQWGTFADEVSRQTYAFAPVGSLQSYARRLATVALMTLLTSIGASWAALAALAVLAFRRCRAGIPAADRSPTHRFAPVVFLVGIAAFPLVVRTPLPRYLTLFLPLAFVWIGTTLERLQAAESAPGARASRLGPVPVRLSVLTLVLFAGSDLAVLAGAHRYLESQHMTNQAFFELRSALASRGACSEGVWVEDVHFNELPPDLQAAVKFNWAYFNFRTIRYILTMDGCMAAMAPAPELLTKVAARKAAAWLIISEHSVPIFAERFDLALVMHIVPGPLPPEPLRQALYRATPR
jgi:hypothetical protein